MKPLSKGESESGQGDSSGSKTGMGIDTMDAYALLIGVGRCQHPQWSLPVTTLDARELQKTLTDPDLCAYPADRVRILSDEGATRDGILAAVDELARTAEAHPDATFFIYYSGHGWRHDGDGGARYFLIPHDVRPDQLTASALPADDFIHGLRRLEARRVLVMMDTCHASGMAEAKDPAVASIPEGFAPQPLPKALAAELSQGEGRAVFLSCREDQKSWILPGNDRLSIFTHHLLAALRGAGVAPKERFVTVSSLMGHLSKGIPASAQEIGREQTPVFKFQTEELRIALVQGGKGLPAEGSQTPAAAEKPAAGSVINVGNATAGRNLVIADTVRDVR